ncbi:hypothetical protein ZWY2020_019367 [Hordeum vulgare]|nr:hypothetical protein ZWY2020_019367 [Hordeum vulgare]
MYCSRISFGLLQGKIVVTEDDMEGGINLFVRQVTECSRVSHGVRTTESKTCSALFFRNVVLCILPYGTISMCTVKILWLLDEMLVNGALHQVLKMYSMFLKFYLRLKARYIGVACGGNRNVEDRAKKGLCDILFAFGKSSPRKLKMNGIRSCDFPSHNTA